MYWRLKKTNKQTNEEMITKKQGKFFVFQLSGNEDN